MAHTVCYVLNGWGTATPNAQIYDTTNAPVGSALTSGYFLTNGILKWPVSVPDGQLGWIDFYPAGSPTLPLASFGLDTLTVTRTVTVRPVTVTDTD